MNLLGKHIAIPIGNQDRVFLSALIIELSDKIRLYYFVLNFLKVIALCERLAGQDANVTTVPVTILRFTRQLTRFFEWTNDVADRLAFSEVK